MTPPSLWAHVRDICQRVEVTPPDHIVAGIDTNFFVTEAPLITTGGDLDGRTLYVSLSLLKALERDEASAVLSHEMAHFHGDTEVSSKLAPLLDHFALYLRDLMDSPLTLPVFYLMRLHRAAMELAIAKHSRDREFVADATAARVVSPEAIGRALVRIGAYARFRDRIERELFDQDAEHDQIAIGARLTSGFVAYGATPEIEEDLDNVFQPHPFDSHPPLDERLAAIARPMDKREKRELIATAPARTLFADIEGAEEREAELWAAYEDRFAQAHAHDLAYRYYPATPEEEAHVLRFFPEQRFELKKGGEVVVSYASLDTPMWGNAIEYDEVKTLRIMETNGDPVSVELHLHRGSKQTLALGKLANKHRFLVVFNEYWVRHNVAREEKKRRDAETPKAAS